MRQSRQKKPFASHDGCREHPYMNTHTLRSISSALLTGHGSNSSPEEEQKRQKHWAWQEWAARHETRKSYNIQKPDMGMFQILTRGAHRRCSGAERVPHLLLAQSLNCRNTIKLLLGCFSWISFALKVIGTSWKNYYFSILYADFIKRTNERG